MLSLDAIVLFHGMAGVLYTYLAGDKDSMVSFRTAFPELYYLIKVYMWGAVICSIWKLYRYFYLFKYLYRNLSK